MINDPIVVVDLFCGAGGFSTGFVEAYVEKHRFRIAEETGLDPYVVCRKNPAVEEWLAGHLDVVAVNH